MWNKGGWERGRFPRANDEPLKAAFVGSYPVLIVLILCYFESALCLKYRIKMKDVDERKLTRLLRKNERERPHSEARRLESSSAESELISSHQLPLTLIYSLHNLNENSQTRFSDPFK
ncbi:hypothetical protein LD39_15505 [Halobacillus sp. BBL2006]|nr:hypothetical protein LD39_15505 [Halobacillus sp. BBL2006]